jgi:hypothetical protein
LQLSRSSLYYVPTPVNDKDRELMSIIDGIHLEEPYLGSRGMRNVLRLRGYTIGRIHVRTVGGTRLELAFENGRWIQKNLSTGKQIPILMPWELIKNRITKAQTFNDLSEAYRNFKGES